MHKSRREFLDDFVAFVGEGADTQARDLAERQLNRSLTALWLKHPWRQYRSPVPFQLTLTVNQSRYALPDYFGRFGPGEVRNLSRSGAIVHRLAAGEQDERHIVAGTSVEAAGIVQDCDLVGVCGVSTQPVSTGDALEVVSSDVLDIDVVVAIAGDDASARWTRNQVTLNGTTPVQIGTWAFVDEFAKAYQASSTPATELTSSRGTVTLRKTAGGAVLQTLFAQESAKEHQVLVVFPKPSAADVLAIPILRRPKRLFHDADPIADLWEPALWEDMLIQWHVNGGELTLPQAASTPRPALIDLVAFDNEQGGRSRTRPFRG